MAVTLCAPSQMVVVVVMHTRGVEAERKHLLWV